MQKIWDKRRVPVNAKFSFDGGGKRWVNYRNIRLKKWRVKKFPNEIIGNFKSEWIEESIIEISLRESEIGRVKKNIVNSKSDQRDESIIEISLGESEIEGIKRIYIGKNIADSKMHWNFRGWFHPFEETSRREKNCSACVIPYKTFD